MHLILAEDRNNNNCVQSTAFPGPAPAGNGAKNSPSGVGDSHQVPDVAYNQHVTENSTLTSEPAPVAMDNQQQAGDIYDKELEASDQNGNRQTTTVTSGVTPQGYRVFGVVRYTALDPTTDGKFSAVCFYCIM